MNNTAFSLLLEAGVRIGFNVQWTEFAIPPGIFVTAINGTVNGTHGKYWQYWVDGQYGDIAADRKELFDGNVLLWKFDVSGEGR